jgi:hypothetical protein
MNRKKVTDVKPNLMDGSHNKEEWLRLCEQAAVEKDPEMLLHLCQEICRLLEERETRLKGGSIAARSNGAQATSQEL